tara:strand:+ start:1282 stop:2271 length:990 start_codon:yes stop_codon:yes gene_type:complete
MNIPSSIIKEYLTQKFTTFQTNNDEFLVNSIFVEDSKMHMSINMSTGLWQDFKSKESGTFAQLVSHVEGISYQEAHKYLGRRLFDSPEALFDVSTVIQQTIEIGDSKIEEEFKNFKKLDLSEGLISNNLNMRIASKTVISRGLQRFQFYIGVEGKYSNRLIIPYKHKSGMVYFQGRRLSSFGMKYLNPGKNTHGVKSSEMLFPFNESMDYVVVTEGPLDAITLQMNGVNATCIQGSMMSYTQARALKGRKVILSFDNDDAGKEGAKKAYNLLRRINVPHVCQVQPPSRFKDWNDFHVKAKDTDEIFKHVVKNNCVMDFGFFLERELATD